MELKQCRSQNRRFSSSLLIVPYGIETELYLTACTFRTKLLIVPYGIETLLSTYLEG